MRFKTFPRTSRTKGRQWYFHGLADGNNQIILRSEGYHNLADAEATVALIQREAADAEVITEGDQP